MNKDQHLEDQEEQYRESVAKSIAHDAAVFVQQGYSRNAALAKATQISDNQLAAEEDPTGTLGTLAESQSPAQPVGKEGQTNAIAAELFKKVKE
jgi:hypothetical protein